MKTAIIFFSLALATAIFGAIYSWLFGKHTVSRDQEKTMMWLIVIEFIIAVIFGWGA